uniref:Uncharacterized protein n=1 Tax=Papio anubis TaxID=9555 RepID=A0A8I5NJD7_PAPAN
NPISTKNTKISQVWRWAPVIPATWEAEAGELLEPGRRGCGEPRLCHCTPAWATRAKLSRKKEKKKKRNYPGWWCLVVSSILGSIPFQQEVLNHQIPMPIQLIS